MRLHSRFAFLVSLAFLAAVALLWHQRVSASSGWNVSAAAQHLDARQTEFAHWGHAERDQDTVCISCHTTVPYVLARPAMRKAMGETGPTPAELAMLQTVRTRIHLWETIEPFYNDDDSGAGKTQESYGTEAVLNAFVLARYGSLDNHQKTLDPDEQKAFKELWATQIETGRDAGAWHWLNFHNEPWEGTDSIYYGAALAMLAFDMTPHDYQLDPAIATHVEMLRSYLSSHYESQPMMNRLLALWASDRKQDLLSPAQRSALLQAIATKQAVDGGWSLAAMDAGWKRRDNTPQATASDGGATGLILIALHAAGISPHNPEIERGLNWIVANQDATTGAWPGYSLNKERDPRTMAGQFMTDSATGFSSLALTLNGR